MSSDSHDSLSTSSLDDALLERVEIFENAWEEGAPPDIDQFLAGVGPARLPLLACLVHVDLERRLKAGEPARVEAYLKRYPDLAADSARVLGLIAAEYRLRLRAEPGLTARDYVQRFPDYADSLTERLSAGAVENADANTAIGQVALFAESAWPAPPDFEVVAELGRGGMGVVYKARQASLKRFVALKMILSGASAGPDELARFRAEAEATARLRHPNIVQVHAVGEYQGRPFLALEYLDGGTLSRRLAGNPQPAREAAALVETLARAVHHAHCNGVIHRDLKPANVLLQKSEVRSQNGREGPATDDGATNSAFCNLTSAIPKVSDFGLARVLSDDTGRTRTGQVFGTPSYMAPEQAAGDPRAIGPAADVFALGAILYEMLVGRPPFKGASELETIIQLREAEPVPPSRLQPGLPRDLDTICLKCLEKPPTKRYASAEALADDLHRFLAHDPILARPTGRVERLRKWARRRPALAVLYGALALLVLVIVGGAIGGLAWHAADLQEKVNAAERRSGAEEQLRGVSKAQSLDDAIARLERVVELTRDDAALVQVNDDAQKQLHERNAQKDVRRRYDRFKRSEQDAVFQGTLASVLPVGADEGAVQAKARAAVREALSQFDMAPDAAGGEVPGKHLSDEEKAHVRDGSYHLRLIWAQLAAGPPRKADSAAKARQAMAVLDLVPAGQRTAAYYSRRAEYRTRAGLVNERQAAPPAATAADLFLMGEAHYQAGEIEKAAKALDEARQRDAGYFHFWARYYLALCRVREGDTESAAQMLSDCLHEQREIPWLYLLRALARTQQGQFHAAEDDLAAAEKRLPADDAVGRFVLFANRGHLRVLEAEALAAVGGAGWSGSLLPNAGPLFAAVRLSGTAAERVSESAVADLGRAIALKPERFEPRVTLSYAWRKRGRFDDALAEIDRAVEKNPQEASLKRERAAVLADRGEAHLAKGRAVDAERDAKAALKLDPKRDRAWLLLAEALIKQSQPGANLEALAALDRYEALARPTADVYLRRAFVRSRLNDFNGMADDYGRALLLRPDVATHLKRGWLYILHFHNPELAAADFAEAARLDRHGWEGHAGRGTARAQQGRWKDALDDAAEAQRLAPPTDRPLLFLACLYAQTMRALDAEAKQGRPNAGVRGQCHDRAVACLRGALLARSPAEEAGYWRRVVEGNELLQPLRSSPAYHQLRKQFGE